MPSRHSAVPNLDLSSFSLQTNSKISSPLSPSAQSSEGPSPLTPRSPKSSSSSPFSKGNNHNNNNTTTTTTTIRPVPQDSNFNSNNNNNNKQPSSPSLLPVSPSLSYTGEPSTPGVTAIPQYPPSPPKDVKEVVVRDVRDPLLPPPSSSSSSSRHTRDISRSFFGNLKAPKSSSSHKANQSDGSSASADHNIGKPKSRGSLSDRKIVIPPKQSESSPDLLSAVSRSDHQHDDSMISLPLPHFGPWVNKKLTTTKKTDLEQGDKTDIKKVGSTTEAVGFKKNKPRFANLLSRSRSIRLDDTFSSNNNTNSSNKIPIRRPSTSFMKLEDSTRYPEPSRSATYRPERAGGRPTGNSVPRNFTAHSPMDYAGSNGMRKERAHGGSGSGNPNGNSSAIGGGGSGGGNMVPSASLSHVSGSLLNNIKQSSSGAADRIGKAGKGFFGKITRSGSTIEREFVSDDNYVCSVINLPVIDQARRTRISKRLEDCSDKTEFWMPALAYRCVDYLNFKGCEEEGLYRVPGSGKEVKHWQRRFDSELDVDLFEEPDLYDINTIGSLFKAWLREVPDELLPKETQARIAEQNPGATTAPQMLKDELSKLPPYHYYLLFAITCHLNLLHSYVEQNKMDYRNLCICFQPCMKIEAYCFYFLVCDWKNCWQGCWTEKEYLQKENEMNEKEARERQLQPSQSQSQLADPQSHETAVSSSGSSQHGEDEQQQQQQQQQQQPKQPKETKEPKEQQQQQRSPPRPQVSKTRKAKPAHIQTTSPPGHTRSISQLPELGPPLSPIRI